MLSAKTLFCALASPLLVLAPAFGSGSIDRYSPTLSLCGGSAADLYHNVAPGAGGCDVGGAPVLDTQDVTYGLTGNDNNNGHSDGEADPFANHLIFFSVDGTSNGAAGTQVRHQSVRTQAMGDVFRSLVPPSLSAANSMAACAPAALGGAPRHVQAQHQTDYNLIPSVGPAVFNPFVPPAGFGPADNLDALELASFDIDGDNVHDRPIYFVLDPASPSLGAFSAADVFLAPPAGVFYQFAPAAMLGLTGADDIDALVIWDRLQIGGADAGSDHALFSLAPGSPALAGPDGTFGTADDYSPADIFVTDFSGAFCLYLPHFQLQLQPGDNIDALDVVVI